MKHLIICTALLFFFQNLHAEEKRHGPKPIEVRVELGTAAGELVFVPSKLTFERGNYYKLVIHNPSSSDHYFTSDAFSTHIYTRKVEVAVADGKTLAEIHGAVHDLEIKPGTTIEWFFFPMTNGTDLKLYCHKEDHEAQGMVASIDIVGSLSPGK